MASCYSPGNAYVRVFVCARARVLCACLWNLLMMSVIKIYVLCIPAYADNILTGQYYFQYILNLTITLCVFMK